MGSSYLSDDDLNVHQQITLDPPQGDQSFLDAIRAYITHIVETMPPPFTLFVSGGVDSQAMLYAWVLSGAPFTAVNVSYNGFNTHDFAEIDEFAKRFNVPIKQIEFDLLDFLENKLEDYAWKFQCSSPQLCTHMAFTELIADGTKILSGNPPVPGSPSMNNTIFGLQRYATLAKVSMVPFFLMSDATAASIAADVASTLYVENGDPYEFKCELYRRLQIPIIPQETKLTGFELIKQHYEQFPARVTSEMKLRHSGLPATSIFDQLFRNKYMIVLKNNYQTKFKMGKIA